MDTKLQKQLPHEDQRQTRYVQEYREKIDKEKNNKNRHAIYQENNPFQCKQQSNYNVFIIIRALQ